jgi:exonuclease III
VLLFTWNLNKEPTAFRLALAHLQRSGYSFIGCFQELPPEAGTTTLARDATTRLVGDAIYCLGVTKAGGVYKHGRVGLFCSRNLTPTASDVEHDARQRMAVISVEGALVSPLWVVGYHGESRSVATERGRIGVDARRELDKRCGRGTVVMLGDFNASPFDAEVCGSEGLFAVRDRDEAEREWASPVLALGEGQRPLYNPMWSLLPEDCTRPAGTLLYNQQHMLRWRIYDQILVSHDLIDKIQGPPEIRAEVAGHRLLSGGRIDRTISDHLPVQLRVKL